MAKTLWSFGHSECNRVKELVYADFCVVFSIVTFFDKKKKKKKKIVNQMSRSVLIFSALLVNVKIYADIVQVSAVSALLINVRICSDIINIIGKCQGQY